MFLTPSNSLYSLHKKPREVSDCLFDRNRPCGSRGYEPQDKKGAEQESPAVYPAGSAAAACTSSACRYPHLSSFTGTAQLPPPPHLRSRGHSEQPQIAPRGATLPESRKQKVLERAHSTETQGGCRKRRAPHQLSTTGCITSETALTASAPLLYKEGR